MKTKKIGTIFLISILALTGIGISYAGLTDTISVYGTVDVATVDLEITGYSGTYVWKVFADPDELVVTNDPTYSVAPEEGFLVSYAEGRPIEIGDPEDYDAVIEFDNLFPCIDFMADIVFHYDGTIPAKVSDIDWDWVGEDVTLPDGTVIPDFINWLMQNDHMSGGFYRCQADGTLFDPLEEVAVGYQLHQCNYFKLIVTIHLPQVNWLQGLEGNGFVNIGVLQWNDECDQTTEDKLADFSLPTTPVNVVVHYPWNQAYPPGPSYFRTTLSNVPAGTYNVWNGDWVGWCVDQINYITPGTTYTMKLYSSYDPANPWPDPEWPVVNWIINHKTLWPGFSYSQMQDAIWNFIGGGVYSGSDSVTLQIISDATGHYEFIPQVGEWVAVLCWPIDPASGQPISVQKTFIEVDP